MAIYSRGSFGQISQYCYPNHLSLWERYTGVSKNYDPEVDYRQKINDLHKDYSGEGGEEI